MNKLVWNGISGALNKQGTMYAERKMGKDHTAFEGSPPKYVYPRDLVTATDDIEAAGYVARAGTYPDGSSDLLGDIEVRSAPAVATLTDGGEADRPQERDAESAEHLGERTPDDSTAVERDDEEDDDQSLARRNFDDLDASASPLQEREDVDTDGAQGSLEARLLRNPFTGEYYSGSSSDPKASPPASPPRSRTPARGRSPTRAKSPVRGKSPVRTKSPPRDKSPPMSAERAAEIRFARAAQAHSAASNKVWGTLAKDKLARRGREDDGDQILARSFIDAQTGFDTDSIDKRLSTGFALKAAWKHGMPMAKKYVIPAAKKFGPKYAKMAMKNGKPFLGKFAKKAGPMASTYGAKFATKLGPKASMYGSKVASKFGPAAQKYAGPAFAKYGGKFAEKFAGPWGKLVGAKFLRRDLGEDGASRLVSVVG